MAQDDVSTVEYKARNDPGLNAGRSASQDGDLPALVGGECDVPRAAEDVVQIDGEAARSAQDKPAPTTLTTWLFRPGQEARGFDLQELPQIVAQDENIAWLDLEGYSEEEFRHVAELLRLPQRGVRTALAAWQRPSLDSAGELFWVTATVAHVDPEARKVRASQLDLFVGRNFLLSSHKLGLPFGERVLGRARRSPELVQLDSAYMLYIMLDELLHYYEGLTENVDDEIEQMEERALTDTSDAFLNDLLHLKRYIFALSRLVEQHRTVFAAFRRPDFGFLSNDEVKPYYRDLEERLGALIGMLTPAKDAVNGTFDIYVSHVSHRTNNIMKILTVVSTVTVPASIILGFFGTSFQGVPLYDAREFWIMVSSILVTTLAVLFAFRRKGWI